MPLSFPARSRHSGSTCSTSLGGTTELLVLGLPEVVLVWFLKGALSMRGSHPQVQRKMTAIVWPAGNHLVKPTCWKVEEVACLKLRAEMLSPEKLRYRLTGPSTTASCRRAHLAETIGNLIRGALRGNVGRASPRASASTSARAPPGFLQGPLQHGLLGVLVLLVPNDLFTSAFAGRVQASVLHGGLSAPLSHGIYRSSVVPNLRCIADEAVAMKTKPGSFGSSWPQRLCTSGAEESKLLLAPQQNVEIIVEVMVKP
mmetsp:Transcript_46679/g.101519  ORF Transcript_46679/g.101519 Transcript_46679/m.101519 type:complete len:257 (-) Transcript_46679:301-1071(-)